LEETKVALPIVTAFNVQSSQMTGIVANVGHINEELVELWVTQAEEQDGGINERSCNFFFLSSYSLTLCHFVFALKCPWPSISGVSVIIQGISAQE
jgi:hypothetical protein